MEFRPIAFLSCLYKILAKVLASGMQSLIPSMQSAFLQGRNLVEGIMVVNKVLNLVKRVGKRCMVFKVYFKKAYDLVFFRFGFNEN